MRRGLDAVGLGVIADLPQQAADAWWRAYWRFHRAYFRYSVVGLEELVERPALVVGYHGRPYAWGMMLLAHAYRERTGGWPHGIIDAAVESVPLLGRMTRGANLVPSWDRLHAAIEAAGGLDRPIFYTPGAGDEAMRSYRNRYRVHWPKPRLEYLRVAHRYHLPIVPAAASGEDDAYLGLTDGLIRVGGRKGFPLWIGVGPLGIWPPSPPWPVRIQSRFGSPIRVTDADVASEVGLSALHARVQAGVQAVLDERSR